MAFGQRRIRAFARCAVATLGEHDRRLTYLKYAIFSRLDPVNCRAKRCQPRCTETASARRCDDARQPVSVAEPVWQSPAVQFVRAGRASRGTAVHAQPNICVAVAWQQPVGTAAVAGWRRGSPAARRSPCCIAPLDACGRQRSALHLGNQHRLCRGRGRENLLQVRDLRQVVVDDVGIGRVERQEILMIVLGRVEGLERLQRGDDRRRKTASPCRARRCSSAAIFFCSSLATKIVERYCVPWSGPW